MRGSRWSSLACALSLAGCGGWASGLGSSGDDVFGHDATIGPAADEGTDEGSHEDSFAFAPDSAADASGDAIADAIADAGESSTDAAGDADAPPYDGPPKPLGTACSAPDECASKQCVDGVCCESSCATSCWSCNGAGTAGYCRWVANGGIDPGSCDGAHTCNGVGGCVGAAGQPCTSPAQCKTSFCVEGVCCDGLCGGVCQTCALTGRLGTCSPIPAGDHDDYPLGTCSGADACSGAGACLHPNGTGCATGAQCISGSCADGFCCDAPCTGACLSCSLAGTIGTCKPIPQGQLDYAPACNGLSACDGKGACLLGVGQACGGPADCASGKCPMGHCG